MSDEPSLPLAVVGVDFRRASARRREGLVLSSEERRRLHEELQRQGVAGGLVCLDTCNRSEWISSSERPEWAAEILRTQMIVRCRERLAGIARDNGNIEPYVWLGGEAAKHLFQVAAGMESFVFGEHEIASQLNRALERSRSEGTASVILNGLGKVAGRLTRDTHKLTLTVRGPRGVHDLARECVLQHVGESGRILVLGAGQIGEKAVRSLRTAGVEPIVANRSLPVKWMGDHPVRSLDELPDLLTEVDAVIVCTSAPEPVIDLDTLAMRDRERPLLIVDLGIPRQIRGDAPGGVRALDLDTLQESSGHRAIAQRENVGAVRRRIERAIAEFDEFCAERRLTLLLRGTQERHQSYVRERIPALLSRTVPNLAPKARNRLESALRDLLRSYTNAVFDDIHELMRRSGPGDDEEQT